MGFNAVRLPAAAPIDLNWPGRPDLSQFKEKVLSPVIVNEAGLAQYYRSERGTTAAVQNGLDIYYCSERQAANWTSSSDPLYKYHQSEWFGK